MSSATAHLSADEIDDVLYLTRANEAAELHQLLLELSRKYQTKQDVVLSACIDEESGNSTLHYCAANGLTALLSSLLHLVQTPSASPSTVPLLNHRNSSGNTPLHWASLNGHLETVKALVEAGADMWIKNHAGNLAVFEAERAEKDDVVAYLLETGGTEKEKGEAKASGSGSAAGEEKESEKDGEGEEDGEGEDVEFTIKAGETDEFEGARSKLEATNLGS